MQSPGNPGRRPVKRSAERARVWAHRLTIVLLAAAWLLALGTIGGDWKLPGGSGWVEALLLLLATAGTMTALTRQLPFQNVLLAVVVIAVAGGGLQAAGVTTGVPFGPFLFGAGAGAQMFKTLPWSIPLIWIVAVLDSRGVARLILRPWRKTRSYGFWLMGLAAGLTMLFDLALDPFATRVQHCWLWLPTKFSVTWQGAPLVNFPSWGVATLLMLAFVTPALINKNPVRQRADFFPLAVWLGALVLFAVGSAKHGMWPAVGVDVALAALAAILAIRGGRW